MDRGFFERDTLKVAAELIGKKLVRRRRGRLLVGRIVETEAYIGQDDPACHASRGLTPRTSVMFEQPGRAYVYFTYGMYNMLNVVTMPEGFPAAVLIRAVEPLEGGAVMARLRGCPQPRDWASGPGKLCVAFDINLGLNRSDLCDASGRLWIGAGQPRGALAWTPRIGIIAGSERLWRCIEAGSPFVSRSKFNPRAGVRGQGSGVRE